MILSRILHGNSSFRRENDNCGYAAPDAAGKARRRATILNISIGRTSKQWKENLKVNSCTLLRRYLCFHLSAQPVFDSV